MRTLRTIPSLRSGRRIAWLGRSASRKLRPILLEKRTVVRNVVAPWEANGAQQILLEKQKNDCFTNVNLTALLKHLAADRYVVYGVVTEICVKDAAMGLLANWKTRVELVTLMPCGYLDDKHASEMVREFQAQGRRAYVARRSDTLCFAKRCRVKTVYIALGSNLGNRAAHLADARRRMQRLEIAITRESNIYETVLWGVLGSHDFSNQVIEASTEWMPRQLLTRLKQIEREMGRRRTIRNGPRIIDLDILLYADITATSSDLKIPHPRMGERRFVLEPLVEIAGELRHPRTGTTIRQMLAAVATQSVRRWEPES